MQKVASGLRATFLIHFVVGAVMGLVFLLVPEWWASWGGVTLSEPFMYRLVGAAILGFSFSSWLAYKTPVWEKVKIIVQAEIVWTIIGTLVLLLGVSEGAFPPLGWVNVIVMALFAVAFVVFYITENA